MYRPDPKLRPLRYAIPNPEGELWDAARAAALRASLRRKEEFLSALLRHG
jgi:hypothetical protein